MQEIIAKNRPEHTKKLIISLFYYAGSIVKDSSLSYNNYCIPYVEFTKIN